MASPIARAAARTASHPCTVVVGSGVAGVASALHLARAGHENIYIVDDNAPMSMTSSLSTECYRDYWPEANMLGLMGRSIDLVDALASSSDNSFGMTRRGYLYLADNAADMDALTTGAWGTGMAVRTHRSAAEVESRYQANFPDAVDDPHRATPAQMQELTGVDILQGAGAVQAAFP